MKLSGMVDVSVMPCPMRLFVKPVTLPMAVSMTSFWSFLQKIHHDLFYVYPVTDTVLPFQVGRDLMPEAIP